MDSEKTKKIDDATTAWCGELEQRNGGKSYICKIHKKYDKIIEVLPNGQQIAFAFVNRLTGDIYRPSSWVQAYTYGDTSVRGNILTGKKPYTTKDMYIY